MQMQESLSALLHPVDVQIDHKLQTGLPAAVGLRGDDRHTGLVVLHPAPSFPSGLYVEPAMRVASNRLGEPAFCPPFFTPVHFRGVHRTLTASRESRLLESKCRLTPPALLCPPRKPPPPSVPLGEPLRRNRLI